MATRTRKAAHDAPRTSATLSAELSAALTSEQQAGVAAAFAEKSSGVMAALKALALPPLANALAHLDVVERLHASGDRGFAARALVVVHRAVKKRLALPPVRVLMATLHAGGPRGARDGTVDLPSLLASAAGVFRARGEPVDLFTRPTPQTPGTLDIEVADRALALGVTLADPQPGDELTTTTWWQGARGPYDPVHLAADERFTPLLRSLVDACLFPAMTPTQPPPALFGLRAVAPLARGLLLARVASLGAMTVAGWTRNVAAIGYAVDAGACDHGDVRAVLRKLVDGGVRDALVRTLRGGLAGELGWSAFDDAVSGDDGSLGVSGAFPVVVARAAGGEAVAVSAEGVVGRFPPLPREVTHTRTERFIEGVLYTVAFVTGGAQRVYWSATDKVTARDDCVPSMDSSFPPSAVLSSGATTEGFRGYRAGDATLALGWGDYAALMADGRGGFWSRRIRGDGAPQVVALDPTSGEERGEGLPAFLAEFEVPGTSLVLDSCYLLPCAQLPVDNALGARDGMIGFRARVRADDADAVECETLDGRRWRGRVGGRVPVALMRMPGVAGDLPVTRNVFELLVHAPDGETLLWSANCYAGGVYLLAGVPKALGLLFWALRTPRDVEGSRALREVAAETLDAPLSVARTVACATRGLPWAERAGEVMAATRSAVRAAFPAVTHPRVQEAIVGAVACAAVEADTLLTRVEEPRSQETLAARGAATRDA